jgi:hypothetical protein
MNDEQFDKLLQDAARRWRVPADPPLEEIWSAVAAELKGRDESRETRAERFSPRRPGWGMVAIAASMALVLGAAGGYAAHRTGAGTAVAVAPSHAALPVAGASFTDQHAMSELVGRTAVLLAALPSDTGTAAIAPELTREGVSLLVTTRALLDSPLGRTPRLHNLLEDLELVLAQVARIEPARRHDDVQFIQTALDEHDLVPRLRSAAADLSLDDF